MGEDARDDSLVVSVDRGNWICECQGIRIGLEFFDLCGADLAGNETVSEGLSFDSSWVETRQG
jgi:hypothetical protein